MQGYASVLFDYDKDGIRTLTGWVSADDSLLVIDRNSDGLIDNKDAKSADLKIWRDLNQDGVLPAGELFALTGSGIQYLDTAY